VATYLLLDGHSLAYRAWFALQEAGMKTAAGQETQAVYGFVSMTTKLIEDFKPDGIAVAFDLSGPTFRDELVDDYKGGRDPMPAPLREQIEFIRQFGSALGVAVLDAERYEADDVLGTLAAKLGAEQNDVIIVTGDRDTYQLVADPYVRVLYNRRGVTDYVLYDEAGILDRTGVTPKNYPFLAALRGDPSDNLPGVPGVGEKTAAKLVNDWGDIDALFANLDHLTPKLRESLAANEERVRLNYSLTPIVQDVPLELPPEGLGLRPDFAALEQLFSFLEMRTPKDRLFMILNKRTGASAPTAASVEDEPELKVEVLSEVVDAVDFLGRVEALVDQSTGERADFVIEPKWSGIPGRSAIDGLGVVAVGGLAGYVDGALLAEPSITASLSSLLGRVVDPLLRERVVGHRTKELMRVLLPSGIDFLGLAFDTAVVAYLVDPSAGMESLEAVAARRGLSLPGESVATPQGQLDFSSDSLESGRRSDETAARAQLILRLATRLSSELDAVEGQALWHDVERPLVRVLARMEVAGVGVDIDALRALGTELTDEARRLEAEVHNLAGEVFNVNSPPQLRVVLYDKLGLRPQRKTKTGYSTDAQTLERLRDQHPIIETLLAYREVEKLRSTYGVGLLAEVAPDGRIHASFNQTVARTGRLSSDAPNLHNIPVRSEGGKRFREVFVPKHGSVFLVADYNQIELRVIAHLAGDPGLLEAFLERRDIHRATAAAVFAVAPEDVTAAQRNRAKMVSYGLAYGMEAYGLAQRLAISVEEATEILNQYFKAFPSVRAYMDQTVADARVRGYTETEFGRRRHLPELASGNFRVRQSAERQAMNAGIQGLAADIFKIALVRLDAELESAGLASRIVLQVHDEIVVETEESERDEVRRLTLQAMENAYPLRVPLEVNIAWGANWADAKSG
jgi:DNA polymerase I